jgi:hypothetical protein
MQKPYRHPSRKSQPQAFWFDFGRLLFPDLINHPRAMRTRMMAIALGLAAMLVGATVGFLRHANNPADVMLIQARQAR